MNLNLFPGASIKMKYSFLCKDIGCWILEYEYFSIIFSFITDVQIQISVKFSYLLCFFMKGNLLIQFTIIEGLKLKKVQRDTIYGRGRVKTSEGYKNCYKFFKRTAFMDLINLQIRHFSLYMF